MRTQFTAADLQGADLRSLHNRDLAYLTEGTAEFDSYIEALQWAQNFALLNRAEMMDRVERSRPEPVSWPDPRLDGRPVVRGARAR